jgi:hypothetical protein
MHHPLDGAKLKVVRAQEHLDAFKRELGTYHDSEPVGWVTTFDKPGFVTVTPAIKEVPAHLSCIIGDCVTNLNAALDYVAWQIGLKFRTPSVVVGKDMLYYLGARGFTGPKTATDPAALDLLQSMQPTVAGYERLKTLNDLVNEDKHRLPLLTVAVIKPRHISVITTETPPCTVISFPTLPVWSTAGGFVADLSLEGLRPEDVKVVSDGSTFITFENPLMPREPAELTLDKIVKCVTDIVPRFEPLFA